MIHFPKFTSGRFSDKAASWLFSLHLCTKRDEAQKRFLVGVSGGECMINALAFLIRLRRWAFCGIPFFSLPCHRRKCTMSPLTELVIMAPQLTWRELLMISKHFHISFSCVLLMPKPEIHKAGTLAPSVQMRKQSQSAQGFPGGHPVCQYSSWDQYAGVSSPLFQPLPFQHHDCCRGTEGRVEMGQAVDGMHSIWTARAVRNFNQTTTSSRPWHIQQQVVIQMLLTIKG